MQTNKRRLAIVGTGHRGAGTWGRDVPEACAEHVALVGLSDTNPERLAVVAAALDTAGPGVTTDLGAMLGAAKPHTLVVCTRDDTHADIIVKALEAGIDVVTEKPMATTAEDCRRILDAEARTGRRVDVAFNYRFAPTSRKIRELVASGRIGEVTSVDFHWYLDTVHGADYFRRWHAYKRHSGVAVRPQGDAPFRPLELVDRLRPGAGLRARRAAQVRRRRAVPLDPLQGLPACGRVRVLPRHLEERLAHRALRGAVGGGRLRARRLRLSRGHRHLRHHDRGDPLCQRRAGIVFAQRLYADRGLPPGVQRDPRADRGPHVREAGVRGAARPRRGAGARHRPLGRADLGRARAGRAFRRRSAAAPEPLRAGEPTIR